MPPVRTALLAIAALACACSGGSKWAGPGGAPAPAARPLAPQPLEGPHASLEDYCDELDAAARRALTTAEPASDDPGSGPGDDPGEPAAPADEPSSEPANEAEAPPTCRLAFQDDFDFDVPVSGPVRAGRIAAPFAAVRLVAIGELAAECRIAVKLDAGWFVQPHGFACAAPPAADHAIEVLVLELDSRDVLGDRDAEVVLRFETAGVRGGAVIERHTSETLVVCGVGASGTPSCLEPLVLAERRTVTSADAGTTAESAYRFGVHFDRRTIAVIGGIVGAQDSDRIGLHPIEFP